MDMNDLMARYDDDDDDGCKVASVNILEKVVW